MKNSAEYIVKTHWGTFSLDEGSYRDYLQGKLWISYGTGKSDNNTVSHSEAFPPNISDRALVLRSQADKIGVLEAMSELGIHNLAVPYRTRLAHLSIDEMNLSVRASNGLKRANAATFGRLYDLLSSEGGIMSVRNLGVKSAKEIKRQFFEECYNRLSAYEKAQYWQEVLDDACFV